MILRVLKSLNIYINNEEVENDFLFIGFTGFRYGADKISTVP